MPTCDLLAGISQQSLNQFSQAWYRQPMNAHTGKLGDGTTFDIEASPAFYITPTHSHPVAGGHVSRVDISLHYPMVQFSGPLGHQLCAVMIYGQAQVKNGNELGFAFTHGATSITGPTADAIDNALVPAMVDLANSMADDYAYKQGAILGLDWSQPQLYGTEKQLFVLYNMKENGTPGLPNPQLIPDNEFVLMLSNALQNTVISNIVANIGVAGSKTGSKGASKSGNGVTISVKAGYSNLASRVSTSTTTDGSSITIHQFQLTLGSSIHYKYYTEGVKTVRTRLSWPCWKGKPPHTHKTTCHGPWYDKVETTKDEHSEGSGLPGGKTTIDITANMQLYVQSDGTFGINHILLGGITNLDLHCAPFSLLGRQSEDHLQTAVERNSQPCHKTGCEQLPGQWQKQENRKCWQTRSGRWS